MTDPTIHRTPNQNCGACLQRAVHDEAELRTFHPYARHGFTPETGWTHPDLLPAGVSMKHATPVSGSTPVERTLILHSDDGGDLLCRKGQGLITPERLSVTCEKCLEILNR